MFYYYRSVLAALLMSLIGSGIALAGSVTSGPQAGEKVPGPFKPLNINGPEAGHASCQYCKNGTRPVAVIFTKEITTPAVARLIKTIDIYTAKNKERGLGSYAVVCSDNANVVPLVWDAAQKLEIQNTILTTYKAGGPERYRLAPDAEVTVLLYNHLTVKANHAFKKDELDEAAINAIVADLSKMLAE